MTKLSANLIPICVEWQIWRRGAAEWNGGGSVRHRTPRTGRSNFRRSPKEVDHACLRISLLLDRTVRNRSLESLVLECWEEQVGTGARSARPRASMSQPFAVLLHELADLLRGEHPSRFKRLCKVRHPLFPCSWICWSFRVGAVQPSAKGRRRTWQGSKLRLRVYTTRRANGGASPQKVRVFYLIWATRGWPFTPEIKIHFWLNRNRAPSVTSE